MNDERDDLEAAQQRTRDLERELAELRAHNQRLEAEVAGGPAGEAMANERRLAAAVASLRHQAELDRRAAKERASAARRREATPNERMFMAVIFVILGSFAAVSAFEQHETGAALFAIIACGVIGGLFSLGGRAASGGGCAGG